MEKYKIYVASSWRNEYQQSVVKRLRDLGFEVYDFKHPSPTDNGFSWSEIDPDWKEWTNEQYADALKHSAANRGFTFDFMAMKKADACVLVMPCGRSAHLEAGWMKGAGKPTYILLEKDKPAGPELMYKMCDLVTDDLSVIEFHLQNKSFTSNAIKIGVAIVKGVIGIR